MQNSNAPHAASNHPLKNMQNTALRGMSGASPVGNSSVSIYECTYFETATSDEVGRYARSTRRVTI